MSRRDEHETWLLDRLRQGPVHYMSVTTPRRRAVAAHRLVDSDVAVWRTVDGVRHLVLRGQAQ